MIEYRSFLNTDPPALVEIWRQQPPMRCLAPLLTRHDLDLLVLGKPYFDPAGLILAFTNGRPTGFVHAGFGPRADSGCIDRSTGVLSQLRVVPGQNSAEVSRGLLDRSMEYLQNAGAKVCFAGSKFPWAPFYLGLYGGSRIPGVPEEDQDTFTALQAFGFRSGEKILVLQRDLKSFRPLVNRSQMAVRRTHQVSSLIDPLLPTWWDWCTFGMTEIFGFRVSRRDDARVVGQVMYWEIQPLSRQWGQATMGLVNLEILDQLRRRGLATYLIGESLRVLSGEGFERIEVQLRESDEPAIGIARRLGFEQISSGQQMAFELKSK